MRIAELYNGGNNKPVISFEFFRPKTEKAEQTLSNTIDILSRTRHDYVSVTFGAGGTTREGSFELIQRLQEAGEPNVVAYIAGMGLSPDDVVQVLDKFKALGVETVFVIRGDEPQDAGFAPSPDALPHASDLLAFARDRYDFCLGAAGYPEGHQEAESLDKDIGYLKLKQDNGAEYIVAQFCLDNRFYHDYVERCRAAGVTIPIVPGIMPVYSPKMLENLARVCGASIPDQVRRDLAAFPEGDKEAVLDYGIDLATSQCRDLLRNGAPGLHFYTMNRGKSVNAIVNNLEKEGLL
ncbi:MAG: methylenetetrahydrofolate reductase [Desulfatibacillaceae bacterium]